MVEYSAGGGGPVAVVSDRYCDPTSERHLTVRKTCVFYPGDGFAVYEHHSHQNAIGDHEQEGGNEKNGREEESGACGELVFRVDSYGGPELQKRRSADHLVLMGPHGDCILTVKKKWPSLHQRWEGFLGGDDDSAITATLDPPDSGALGAEPSSPPTPTPALTKKPLFSVRRSSIIGRFGKGGTFLVDAYPTVAGNGQASPVASTEPGSSERHYHVEGCFPHRCCAVYEGSECAVAEISRKVDASTGVVLGRDVFCLRLVPGFDAAFAMGIVLALDQICGNDAADNDHDHVEGEDLSGHSCKCNGSNSPGADAGGCSPNGRGSPVDRASLTCNRNLP